jgi:hypothetical protein
MAEDTDYFSRNQQWVKPGSNGFSTDLGQEEPQFRQWVQQNKVPFDLESKFPQDYDMRGFYKALKSGDPRASSAIDPNDSRIHYPDYWKTPYHETFSSESQWATPDAPAWNDKDQLVAKDGTVVFDDRAQKVVTDEKPNSIDPFGSEKYESPTLAAWAKQAAGKDVDTIKNIYGGAKYTATGLLPDLFDAVKQSNENYYGPGPKTMSTDELPFELRDKSPGASAETAMNLVGLGAGGAVKGAAGALGGKLGKPFLDQAVPVDIWATHQSKLIPGQLVTAGPGGPTGTFQGISPGGSTLVNWNAGKTATFKPTKNEDWLAEGLDNIFGKNKPTAAAEQPLKVSELKPVGGQLGSNTGGIFADSTGGKYYIKQPATPDHVANELAASRLYQLAGSNTLKYHPVEGGGHVATKWENLEKNNVSQLTPAERKQATEDFATHAWLSNWDAVGLGGDNVGILNGKPVVLDVGGSLKYRAKGEPKGNAFGTQVTEIDSLRNPNLNPDSAGLFGKMTDEEIKQSAKRVVDIPDDAIREAAGNDELANKLIARKHYLADRFGIKSSFWDKPAKPSFSYSKGEAQGLFKQAIEDSWAMLKKGFEQAKGVKSPPSLLDQIPGLKEKMPDHARVSGGYTQPAYRGLRIHPSNQLETTHYGPTMYSTADPVLADMYSDYLSHHGGPNWQPPEGTFGEGAGVVPLWIDTSKYHFADAQGAHWSNFNWKAIEQAKSAGKPGVIIDNVWDEPNSTHSLSGPRKIFITFAEGLPTVKSKFASKFDPTSPDMMQGIGAIGIGGPAGYVSMAEPSGKMDQKPQQGQPQPQGQGMGQGSPLSPGVAKFLIEFLKSNPDLAKEMSTRMQAVINGKQIQQQQAPAGPQPPPQMPPQQGM